MRIISLVIEGLEQAANSGCLEWLFAQDADIICLQDTRCAEHMLTGNAFSPITTTRTFSIITTTLGSMASPSTARNSPRPSSGA